MSRTCSVPDCGHEAYTSPPTLLCESHTDDLRKAFCAIVGQRGGYHDQEIIGIDWEVAQKFVEASSTKAEPNPSRSTVPEDYMSDGSWGVA